MPKNRSIFTIAADIVLNRGKVEKDSRAVGKALSDIGAKGKKAGKETAKGFGELQNLMPGVLKDFSSLGKTLTAGGIIAAVGALSIEIFKFAQGINKSREEVKKFTKESGAQLDALTGRVVGLSKAYEKDLNEVLQATNALSKQMGIGFDESLDIIQEGFIRGADASGELLSNLKEYPTFFKEAGFSAGQLINIISQQVDQGIFGDKGVDAVKEFLLRVREMPKATADALKAIGIDGKEMQRQIAAGTLTIQEAFVQVSKRLSELPEDSQLVGQTLADVFGGAGEDAGVSFITSFKDGFGEITDVARTEAQEVQAAYIKSGQEVETEWNKIFGDDAKIWTQMKTGFNNAIKNLIGGTRVLAQQAFKGSAGLLGIEAPAGKEVPGGFVGPQPAPDAFDIPDYLNKDKINDGNEGLKETARIFTDIAQILGKDLTGQSLGGVQGPGKTPEVTGIGGQKQDSGALTGEALLLADAFYGVTDAFGAMIAGFANGENGLEIFWQSFKQFALQMIAQMAALVAMSLLLNALLPGISGLTGGAGKLGEVFGLVGGGGGFGNIFKTLGGFTGNGGGGTLQGIPGQSTITGSGSIGGQKSAVVVTGRIRGEDIFLSNQTYQNNR